MTDTAPVVSALIRTRNRPHWFAEALESALDQSLGTIEVLVVEDGGTPYAGDVARRLGDDRVRVIRNEPGRGVAAASRQAAEAACGRYVAFLDDDDLWDPAFLETLVEPLETDPELTLAFCRRRLIDEDGDTIARPPIRPPRGRGRIRPFVAEALVGPMVSVANSAVIRRSAVDWSELSDDVAWDRWVSYLACRNGGAAWFEPLVLSRYRIHAGSRVHVRPPGTLDSRVVSYRRFVADPRLAPWRPELEVVLQHHLLDRALDLDRHTPLARARHDAKEAVGLARTPRAVAALAIVSLPHPAAIRCLRITRAAKRWWGRRRSRRHGR